MKVPQRACLDFLLCVFGCTAEGARGAALSECGSRVGSGCVVRVWGCNGHVVVGLGLDRAARREIQAGLQAGGFDPGGADGMFGPRTRAAIAPRVGGADSRPRPAFPFRSDRTCAGQSGGASCWKQVSQRSVCYVWVDGPLVDRPAAGLA